MKEFDIIEYIEKVGATKSKLLSEILDKQQNIIDLEYKIEALKEEIKALKKQLKKGKK